jgi:hypothetical protein
MTSMNMARKSCWSESHVRRQCHEMEYYVVYLTSQSARIIFYVLVIELIYHAVFNKLALLGFICRYFLDLHALSLICM